MATEKASGNDGKVLAGVTDLKINRWTMRVNKKFEEVTNSGTGQVGGVITKQQLLVQRWLTGHVEADLDLDTMPTDDPPDLAGVDVVALKLYLDATTYHDIPEAQIENLEVSLAVAGKISYAFDYTSDDTFTLAA
jgi:hypothetical protein